MKFEKFIKKAHKGLTLALVIFAFALTTACAADNNNSGSMAKHGVSSQSTTKSGSASVSVKPSVSVLPSASENTSVSVGQNPFVDSTSYADLNSVSGSGLTSTDTGLQSGDFNSDDSASGFENVSASEQAGNSSGLNDVSVTSDSGTLSIPDYSGENGSAEVDNSSSAIISEDQPNVYQVNVYVNGELYKTVYSSSANDYSVTVTPPADITTDSDRGEYFYGWFTDENFEHRYYDDYRFTDDGAIYGMTIPVDESAFVYETSRRGVTITGLKNPDAEYIGVPSTINGRKVESIGNNAFEASNIKVAYLSEGIKTIHSSAFYNCRALDEVVLPESLERISLYCFGGCENLRCVKMGEGVKEIASYAFGECSLLSEIVLGGGVKKIAENAFEGCVGLSAVYYNGTQEKYERLEIEEAGNETLLSTPVYFYAAERPNEDGNYWHFGEDGKPLAWNEAE